MKRLLDLTSHNIDVGQIAQHLFLRYLFFRVFLANGGPYKYCAHI